MPIALLLQLASAVPFLAKYLGAPDAAQKIADKVGAVVGTLTGAANPEEAVKSILASEELKQKFALACNEQMQHWDAIFLADVQDARKRDTELRKSGQRNYRAETMYILAVGVICGLGYLVWTTPGISEYVKGVSTLVLGRFLGYLDNIYNFEFGTTRTSRDKDETIKQLSKES